MYFAHDDTFFKLVVEDSCCVRCKQQTNCISSDLSSLYNKSQITQKIDYQTGMTFKNGFKIQHFPKEPRTQVHSVAYIGWNYVLLRKFLHAVVNYMEH